MPSYDPTPNCAYAFCDHCHELTGWPRWRRYEIGEYIPLCWRCSYHQEWTFTEDQAIMQALIIIGMRQGINRTAVQR